jgi:hypothetical protein
MTSSTTSGVFRSALVVFSTCWRRREESLG